MILSSILASFVFASICDLTSVFFDSYLLSENRCRLDLLNNIAQFFCLAKFVYRMSTGFAAYFHLHIGCITSRNKGVLQRGNRQIQRQRAIHAGNEPQFGVKRLGLAVFGIDDDGVQPHAL